MTVKDDKERYITGSRKRLSRFKMIISTFRKSFDCNRFMKVLIIIFTLILKHDKYFQRIRINFKNEKKDEILKKYQDENV